MNTILSATENLINKNNAFLEEREAKSGVLLATEFQAVRNAVEDKVKISEEVILNNAIGNREAIIEEIGNINTAITKKEN